MLPYIIVGVIVLILSAVIGYYVARFMKGKVQIELARNTAGSGEPLSGRVALQAKRSIHGLLKVALVGREKRRSQSGGNNSNSTEWVEVYRQDHVLEETRDFPAGYTQTYDFEIVAPTKAEARGGLAALREKAGDGVMGSIMNMAASAADMMQGRIYWHVEVRLDADGVDLFTKQKVTVQLRD